MIALLARTKALSAKAAAGSAMAIAIAILASANPARAQNSAAYACMQEKADPSLSAAMMDTMLARRGLAEPGPSATPQLNTLLAECYEELAISDAEAVHQTDLIAAALFRDEARRRFAWLGFDIGWLEAFMDEALTEVPESNAAFANEHRTTIRENLMQRVDVGDPNDRLIGSLLDIYLASRVRIVLAEDRIRRGQ